jgi:GWxTD domain-containing protein
LAVRDWNGGKILAQEFLDRKRAGSRIIQRLPQGWQAKKAVPKPGAKVYNKIVKKRVLAVCLVLLFGAGLFASLGTGQKKKSPKDLPVNYRKWLEEEVVYIITSKEKEVFLQLETDREREIFIEAFWKQRDTDPLTPENEFKVEHYKRVAYANEFLGREGPGAGWRTDMGRLYVILGAPQQIERYENVTEIYPVIIWFYDGMAKYGIPNSFYIMFWKKSGMGEFQLYSPVKDGPASLLIHYKGDMANYNTAYNQLMNVEPTIADASLSFLPEEAGRIMSPSIASEILVTSRIPSIPRESVKDTYAEKLLAYKDVVEVDYTANYIDNDNLVGVIQEENGVPFVHYLIEPAKLTFIQTGDRFRANLEVNGKVSDLSGKTIYQFDRSIPIDFTREQVESVRPKLFSFQDLFPLIPGRYKLNILLKNTMSREFTSLEKDITVSQPAGPSLSRLILSNKVIPNSAYRGQNKPFLIGDTQLVPSPRNDFTTQDRLHVYFQVLGLDRTLRESAVFEFTILREDQKISSTEKPLAEYADKVNIVEELPLAGLASAYYRIKVSLLDKDRKEVLSEQADFVISHLPVLPRPWLLSLPLPPIADPVFSNILGNQYLNSGDHTRAKARLAEAYGKIPTVSRYALDYCRLLLEDNDYRKIKEVASPFLQTDKKFDFLLYLGESSQALGELAEAIARYKEYLAHFGANINVLNSIGDCYFALGNWEEARVAWQRSLELSPNQEETRKKLESLKEKK